MGRRRKRQPTVADRLDKLTVALVNQQLTLQAQQAYLERMFKNVLLLGNFVSRIYDRAGVKPQLMIGLLDQVQAETEENYNKLVQQLSVNPTAFMPPSATDTAWLAGALERLKK